MLNNVFKLKEFSNFELRDEVERRIKNGEWKINADINESDANVSYITITSLSFKEEIKNKENFLDLEELWEQQGKKVERERQNL